jgi:hypothetical protein
MGAGPDIIIATGEDHLNSGQLVDLSESVDYLGQKRPDGDISASTACIRADGLRFQREPLALRLSTASAC